MNNGAPKTARNAEVSEVTINPAHPGGVSCTSGGNETVYILNTEIPNDQYKYNRLNRKISEVNERIVTAPNQLNYSDPLEIKSHQDLLSEEQKYCLAAGLSKYKNERLYTDIYTDNLYFIIHAQPSFMSKYCYCGATPKYKVRGKNVIIFNRCCKRNFCSRCALTIATKWWQKYLLGYDPEMLWEITFSFNQGIPFNHKNCYGSLWFWNVIKKALKTALRSKKTGIRGYLLSEETSIDQFLPLRVLPHSHAIVLADHIDEDDLNYLSKRINASLKKLKWPRKQMPVLSSIQYKHIQTKAHFKAFLKYMIKPIEIKTAYATAWAEKVETGLREACDINNEVAEFIVGSQLIKYMPQKHNQLAAGGEFHPRSPHFMGKTNVRKLTNWNDVQRISCTDDDWNEMDEFE